MITVAEAEQIIQDHVADFGTEVVPFEAALGRVLAEDVVADRDLPPCHRVTMDGIAIRFAAFERGLRAFTVKGTVAAGHTPVEITADDECVEIMTGAALPASVDSVVRYEDVKIHNGIASITVDAIRDGQNVHRKGRDKKQGEVVAFAGQVIDSTLVSMAASVGMEKLLVSKLPCVVIISTGDELVEVDEQPTSYQVRHSNNYTVMAVLRELFGIRADKLHLPDEPEVMRRELERCLAAYDVLILSGGVSAGKFDYLPGILEDLRVKKLFHKVQQRPGKPFWFGIHEAVTHVFAFPGNPVSTFMCLHRYFVPWLLASLKSKVVSRKYAVLDKDVTFQAPLQYFMQVKITVSEQGQLLAMPMEGNGSGDFANLLDTDAFMELPQEQSNFKKGEVYRIWPFKRIL